ncbi:BLOC-3 complex member HPS1-like [Dreissena polymorpha]|uniref:BLOC-3 complex member HPS1-like n=1 Tax=Dreissena polymorpha TaxID=45954 RepID=UPI002265568B|nr:BLOC-3 complex member HPS1-like [Dreissena polymorpha]
MTSWLLTKLHNGYTMISAREGDYHFSYFIWFENVNGDPEVAQRPYRADCTAPPPDYSRATSTSRYFMHKCFPNDVSRAVHCNELFMMHVGLVNTQYIAGHCRQLAAKNS